MIEHIKTLPETQQEAIASAKCQHVYQQQIEVQKDYIDYIIKFIIDLQF